MRGGVAAGHPLTAQAGAETLAAGGNAVDACIAAAAVSWVVESTLTGPGSGGFMLVHRARDRRQALLDFAVAIPGLGLAIEDGGPMDLVRVPFGAGETVQEFRIGGASCAVPGAVAGLSEAHRLYGSMPWSELLAPAIALAGTGFELTAMQALVHVLLEAVLHRGEEGHRLYGPPQRLLAGERITLPDLARTLSQLAAEGPDAFYHGDLARGISTTVRDGGGRVTEADLAAYRVIRRRPVRAAFRGHELVSNPPPSSGGVLIAYALRLLDSLGVAGSPGAAGQIALLAEVARATERERGPGFAAALRRSGLAATVLGEARVAAAAAGIRERLDRAPVEERSLLPSTTHISVIDGRGNAASLSASTGCGSGIFVPGTGIHLNNMLGEVDLNPEGRLAGPVGRRLTSMMSPSMLLEGGRPRLVLGSAGSERLRGAIVQVVVNVVDHGMGVSEAIDYPRTHLSGSELHVEAGTKGSELDRLEQDGYELVRWPGPDRNLFFGGVAAVGQMADGRLEAAGDARRGGHGVVIGLEGGES